MAAARNGIMADVQRTLGDLTASVRELMRTSENNDREARGYREQTRRLLKDVNDKVDPLLNDVTVLKLDMRAHQVAIKSLEDLRIEARGGWRVGKFFGHMAWAALVAIVLLLSGNFKAFISYVFK